VVGLYHHVYAPFALLNRVTDFHEIRYTHYTIWGHANRAHSNFLQSEITTWWTHELVKWDWHFTLQGPKVMNGESSSRKTQPFLAVVFT